ncbi:terminase large subunit [Salmonella phage 37]|uniref:Terminase large subunit n=1 Tax=Salmonella phage 37 TaxID=1654890 RepID=A0A0N7CF79_9CAUD|nr:terminase large subunit [Salmonella phage 37]AKJ73883.1 terminase large subunit [Salmonella phage 37]
MKFKSIGQIISSVAEQLRPPMRMTVADAAAKYRYVNQPGAYVGDWLNSTTPYMVEPMNMMNSRAYDKMAFVGPAQSGKTDALILNSIVYSVKVDPMDLMIYCPTSTAARDFSMRRVDRLHRHSPKVGEMLMKNRDADNKFDKHYVTGIILTLSYPSVTELAGRPVGRIIITDYDRIDDDIGGDGNAFDLASNVRRPSGRLPCVRPSPRHHVRLKTRTGLSVRHTKPHHATVLSGYTTVATADAGNGRVRTATSILKAPSSF